MKHRAFTRMLSLLLLIALLCTELGASQTYALDLPAEEAGSVPVTEESSPSDDSLPSDENPDDPAAPSEDLDGDSTQDSSVPDGAEEPDTPPAEDETESDPSSPPQEDVSDLPEDTSQPEEETPDNALPESTEEDDTLPEDSLETEEPLPEEEPLTPEEQAEAERMAEIEQVLLSKLRQRSAARISYESELANFPSSYQSYLRELHEDHPDWVFVAVDTGLTWDEAVSGEYGDLSTVDYNLNGETSGLLLNNHGEYYDSSSYSSTNHYQPIDGRHVSSSRAMVAYYMDPRNFLMDQYIFQFEDQSYSSVQTLDGVRAILAGTDLATASSYVTTSGNTRTFADLDSEYGTDYPTIIYDVGLATGVSPYFLASKIVQETGGDTSYAAISGRVSGYIGYYNFYNIGATSSASGGAVYNGLAYARSRGWSNPVLAIYGGAEFLASSYISNGQNTPYYMRFNVSPDARYSTFTHQYMSATYAVASEASNTYDGYEEAGAVDNAFLFYIPVYDNMPSQDSTVSLTAATRGTVSSSRAIYSSPSASSSRVTTLSSGTTVTILGGSITSTTSYINRLYYPYWYRVQVTVSGRTYTGYIQEQYVTPASVYTLSAGSTRGLSSILSTSGSTGTIYYETSDPDVATVSDSGTITARSNGRCTIYAISGGGSFDAIGLTVSGSTSGGLATPSLTSIENAASGVTVRWNAVSGASGYRVFRKSGNSGWLAIADNVTSTSYTDTSAVSGTSYSYTVRAYRGSYSTANANRYSATYWSGYNSTGRSIRFLSTPTLQSASASSSGITIRWSVVSGATGYSIHRKVSGTGWTTIATLDSGSTTSYTDRTTLTSGTRYIYTVRALNGSTRSYYDTDGISAVAGGNTGGTLATPTLANIYSAERGVTIRWNAVSGASGYRVFRKSGSSGWLAIADNVTSTSYTDTSAVSGTSYSYTVRAYRGSYSTANANRYSATYWSSYNSSGVSVYYLAAPSLTSIENAASGVTVRWNTVAGAAGYRVFRKSGSGSWTVVANNVTSTSYTDRSASSGTNYTYTVRAYRGAYSTASDSLYSTAYWSSYQSAGRSIRYLATPTLQSASAGSSGITIRWSAVSGATGYSIHRKVSGTGWTTIATLDSGSATSYTDHSTLTSGTRYIYTVRALNGAIRSYYDTAGISVTAGSGGTTNNTLAAPTLANIYNAERGVTIRWNAVSGASGYRVFRKSGNSSWIVVTNNTTSTTYTDNSVSSGTRYTYTVRAYRGAYSSAADNLYSNTYWSSYNSTGISVNYLAAPSLNSASAASSGVTVRWSAVPGAAGYRVFRKSGSGSWAVVANNVTSTSYTDRSAESGTSYTYTVRAYRGSYSTAAANLYSTAYWSSYRSAGISATASGTTLVNYVTTGNLNYRTGPGFDYPIAGTLPPNTVVQVVSGASVNADDRVWYRAYINGSYYYLSSAYLERA